MRVRIDLWTVVLYDPDKDERYFPCLECVEWVQHLPPCRPMGKLQAMTLAEEWKILARRSGRTEQFKAVPLVHDCGYVLAEDAPLSPSVH